MNDELVNGAPARRHESGGATGTRRRFPARLVAALLLSAILPASPAGAAEDAPATGPATTTEGGRTSTETPPGPAPAADADASGGSDAPGSEAPATSPEVFVPSEEISEDFTVSFPVDI